MLGESNLLNLSQCRPGRKLADELRGNPVGHQGMTSSTPNQLCQVLFLDLEGTIYYNIYIDRLYPNINPPAFHPTKTHISEAWPCGLPTSSTNPSSLYGVLGFVVLRQGNRLPAMKIVGDFCLRKAMGKLEIMVLRMVLYDYLIICLILIM
jgi:hypothetical protein